MDGFEMPTSALHPAIVIKIPILYMRQRKAQERWWKSLPKVMGSQVWLERQRQELLRIVKK